MDVTSASVDNVGSHICAFAESVEQNPEIEHEELLIDHKATSFYIFVNGEIKNQGVNNSDRNS